METMARGRRQNESSSDDNDNGDEGMGEGGGVKGGPTDKTGQPHDRKEKVWEERYCNTRTRTLRVTHTHALCDCLSALEGGICWTNRKFHQIRFFVTYQHHLGHADQTL